MDVAPDGDARPGTGGPAGLFGDLEGEGVEGDDGVLADPALFLFAEDRVEIDVVQRHERRCGIARRPRKLTSLCARIFER